MWDPVLWLETEPGSPALGTQSPSHYAIWEVPWISLMISGIERVFMFVGHLYIFFRKLPIQFLCCSFAKLCLALCDSMDCRMPGFPISHHLLEFAQVHVHCIGDSIQISHPLLPSSLLSIFPSIKVFSNNSAVCIRWPRYWSFSFSISHSNEYSGLISFEIDWFGLLAVQGTLKSLLQHHSSKSSVLQCSAFFMVQLSQPYMTTGKTTALTIWTFVC